ncbi:hypothetical protein SAMN05216337_105418 [Bradyrhizobium brasilense]|uniref:Uncharacterized protein n=1 Tax=Bradyrhizobium brasilense TaxID=1419277 RepID=A0A1G7KT68_9BRAD|nr:hypothetical protein SAMN05216337_105418 [Bradyrhizobium brasilense]
MRKTEPRLIDEIKRQLEAIPSDKRYLSWQFAYLPILEKRLREHGF